MKTFISNISNKEFPVSERVSGKIIRPSVLELIQKSNPEFTTDKYLSMSELTNFREQYAESYLTKQIGELTELEKTVLSSMKATNTLTDKLDVEEDQEFTFGQRVADKVAYFGGSWTFIISFFIFLVIWIFINMFWLANKGFDPYPFILLNLILSCIAAMQAPVIMMSQNRQEEKDRERSKNDYMINLKSELEIRMLHEKIDNLIINQQQEVLEVHRVQVDLMNNILKKVNES